MNETIIKLAREIINKGYTEVLTHPESSKAISLLEKAIRKENEKLNGKNIYCMHSVTACNSCKDNYMRVDYDYETAQKMIDEYCY